MSAPEFTTPHSPGVNLVIGETDHFLLDFETQAVRYPDLGTDAFGHSGATGGGAPENSRLVAAVMSAIDR